MNRKAFILANTQIFRPLLCPEIPLHLITDSCTLWYAKEEDLKNLAIGDPYWGFCWPGGQALARFIMDHPSVVQGKRIIDFGAGCGVEGIAAIKSGAKFVLGVDIDPFSAEAIQLNAALNGFTIDTTTRNLIGHPIRDFELLLAGDMFYDPIFSEVLLRWFESLADSGLTILFSDPGRGNVAGSIAEAIASYRAPADVDLTGKFTQETRIYRISPPHPAHPAD